MTSIAYGSIDSPVGTLWIAVGHRGLAAVSFGVDEALFCHQVTRGAGAWPNYCPGGLDGVDDQLAEYFDGQRTSFDIPLDLGRLSAFQRSVLEAVHAVPYGTVQSYADIAWAVGKPGAARAAGSALAINPISIVIPCHRIIRSDGTLGEYGPSGVKYKLLLLALEGVEFAGGNR